MKKNNYENLITDEERALYGIEDAAVVGCRFDGPADGESALKECKDIVAEKCFFNLRYPLWHVTGATLSDCELTENCRAALWYDRAVSAKNTAFHGIKAFRECEDVALLDCDIVSPEVFWRCRAVSLDGCALTSEYPFFECRDLSLEAVKMKGKYSFQYVENASITGCELDTKDAFWHSKNVTVTDCTVRGEYLGWYSENLHLIRCRIIGTQPLCYCKGLVLEDCTMEQTDLSFERSEVNATVKGSIDSVKNPASGYICADAIGTLIMEKEYTHPERVTIEIKSK